MFKKMKVMPILIIIVIGIVGFVQINILNTKALSPIGNAKDNYELVSEEFGEDFKEFIKDNAEVKIYQGEGDDDDTTIKINEKEFRLKKENPFLKTASTVGTKIKEGFLTGKEKIDNKINEINKNNSEKENTNTELDEAVDDFIKKREENTKPENDKDSTSNIEQDSENNKNDTNR
ncbi:MAG: hypothetical protein ACRDA5_00890 [Clostridium sp.]